MRNYGSLLFNRKIFINCLRTCKQLAFTLAEILITLAIIGVVAALTIPNLISRYNEKVIITNLKKTLSELSQVIIISESENGNLASWNYGAGASKTTDFIDKYIAPYYKNVKKCNNAQECGFPCQHGWRRLDGECANEGGFNYYQFNGKPVATHVNTYNADKNMAYVRFYIDVDGLRGDSIMGKDVHTFTLFNYKHETEHLTREIRGLHMGGICGYWGCYNQKISTLMSATHTFGTCNKENKTFQDIHSGKECGLVLQMNNWKVPENYPIKF